MISKKKTPAKKKAPAKRVTKPSHKATKERKESVKAMAAVGISQEDIALTMGIDPKTLRKHYRYELDTSSTLANAAIGGKLYQKALSGDTAAMIFWAKTRMGFRETINSEITGPGGGPVQVTKIERTVVSSKHSNP